MNCNKFPNICLKEFRHISQQRTDILNIFHVVKQLITIINMNCNEFPKICLKEFRHISQQRADILNIFYDGEYKIMIYD
jgi:hypothetical protein